MLCKNSATVAAFFGLGTEIDHIMPRTLRSPKTAKMSVKAKIYCTMKNIYNEMMSPTGVEVNIMPVVGEAPSMKVEAKDLPSSLPILALRNAVIFPGTIFPVTIGREKSVQLVSDAEDRDGWIGAVPQTDVTVEEPDGDDLCRYGTACRVMKTLDMPDGSMTAILQGVKLLEVDRVLTLDPYIHATVIYHEEYLDQRADERELRVLAESLKEKAAAIVRASSFAPKEAVSALQAIDKFHFLVNFIATTIEVENFEERTALLPIREIRERGMALLKVLETQNQLLEIKQEINQKVKSDIDQQQREYFLNNQLRTIQEELGMDEGEEMEKMRRQAAPQRNRKSEKEQTDTDDDHPHALKKIICLYDSE